MKRLVIIDGKSVFYRGYYAMGSLSLSDGTPTGGVFGFASLAFEVIRKLKPDYVVVAWDKKGTSISRRLEIFDGYKAGRKKAPDDFYTQIPILHNFLKTLGWPLFECDGYEADDILGTLSKQADSLGIESCLITSDLDMLQLIDNNTKVFAMKKGFSTIEEFDLAYFEEKYGLKQAQFLDLKALQGDSSDNIPGVSGIGPKTATSLLQEFFTLEGIYENIKKIKPSIRKKLESGKESAFMSKKLAEIWLDAPVELNLEQADIKNFNYKSVLEILKKLEFNSLVRKIPQEMKSNNSDKKNQINIFDNLNDDFNLEIIPDGNIDDILLSRDIFIDFENDIFTLSNGENIGSLPKNSWKKINENIKNKRFIFFNSKNTFHKIDNKKIQLNFEEIYDIQQMEFLLNPLIRDKSINGILNQEINEENPKEKVSALVSIFNKQQEKLKTLPQIKKIAEELDFPLSKVIFKMEKEGVKINQQFFKEISQEFSEKIETLQSEIWEITEKEFNIASPLQLSKVLFEDLKLPTKGIKKSKTGFSTDQKTLDKLRDIHPVISKIEQFREFSKIKNTYVDALPKLADENDRIHTTFHQDITTTGRLSSSNPNLQNIPIRSEIGRKIRTGFIAEEGKVLVTADYSQFELRLAAVMSGDKKMISNFNSGSDIHSKTASEMFKIPIENITPEQRRAAKVINFGVLYGMSAHRLATELKTSFTEAKKFIENYFEVRKPIADFIASTILQAEEQGFVETMFGRRRPTPDIKSSNFIIRESAKRAAANMPIQGTEADLMKKAMLSIDKEITQKNLGKQILQIHDSILIETTPEKAKKVAEILKREMENICLELKIKLQVDVKIGKNWAEI